MTRPARRHALRSFRRDERGFVLVFFAVCIPALLGLIGLAIDGARLMALDTQLAAAADAEAIAAATRLDRSPGAIPNARAAAHSLSNRATLADAAATRSTFRFAERLSDLRQSATFSLADSSGRSAVYVEATTGRASLTASFLQLVGFGGATILRRAIAESQYYACDVTPMVMCQPDPDAFVARARSGRQFLLRYDGGKGAGSIALLDRPDAGEGRQTLRQLASNAPQLCYADGVRLRTTLTPAEFDEAIGLRFDRYQGRSGPVGPDLALYPPAPNVVQGRHRETCRSPPDGGSVNPPYGLPRDSAYQGLRLSGLWDQGLGDWKTTPAIGGSDRPFATALDEYIAWNHGDKSPAFHDQLRASATRYELYLKELGLTPQTETNPVDTRSYGASVASMPTGGPNDSPLKESPVPVCYAGTQRAVEARRRVVYLSIADCAGFPEAATAANLSRHVGKFFLTEPSDLGATLVELVDILQPTNDDGKLRHVVQLVATD